MALRDSARSDEVLCAAFDIRREVCADSAA